MSDYYRNITARLGLTVLLAGTLFMFSSCDGQNVENASVSETDQNDNEYAREEKYDEARFIEDLGTVVIHNT